MPQLDKLTFVTQVFWLFFFFLSLYFIHLKSFLPYYATLLKKIKKTFQLIIQYSCTLLS